MATPKVMKLVDPHTSELRCKVCGSVHWGMIKHGGHFYRGAWQCAHGCKLPSRSEPLAWDGWSQAYIQPTDMLISPKSGNQL